MEVDDAPHIARKSNTGREPVMEDAFFVAPKPTRSTRELLVSIAQMADETVRSSREKLNVARFTCGLVRISIRSYLHASESHSCRR